MWGQVCGINTYASGAEPNDFLVEMIDQLHHSNVLCIAEGEVRNAVWLSQRRYVVTGVLEH